MNRPSRSRVAQLDEREVLASASFRSGLKEVASRLGIALRAAEKQAATNLEELAVRPQDRYLDCVAKLAEFMISRSYDPKLDVNAAQLDHLKQLSRYQPLVFLWSHKSHLDSFVFMRAMYDNGFIPQPLSFAGINMKFFGFGALAKRSGAIFVRRSFTDDEIYKLVFTHYIDYLVSKRLPLSWSIEGTRSRTGKLMPPRLGLINWVVDAYRRSACETALLVPVSISFDQIAEMDDYVSMQRGQPKRKESLKWFYDYIAGMKSGYGRIYVRFAEPVSLSESITVNEAMLTGDQKPERIQTQKLAFEVCSRIEHATPIKVTDLITLVLLAANDRALTAGQIQAHSAQVGRLITARQLPTAGDLDSEDPAVQARALELLTRSRLLHRDDQAGEPVWSIMKGKQLAAAYYRNTIIHYFLDGALAEAAMAAVAGSPTENPEENFRLELMCLRDLLKFEFFFKARAEFLKDVEAYLEIRFGNRATKLVSSDSPFKSQPPLFGHGILRSFVEAYFVLSRTLLECPEGRDSAFEPGKLSKACLERGEILLQQRQIHCESALSKALFDNATRLAAHRGLLCPKGPLSSEELIDQRNRFALEMDHVLAAINRLQREYDRYQLGITCDN